MRCEPFSSKVRGDNGGDFIAGDTTNDMYNSSAKSSQEILSLDRRAQQLTRSMRLENAVLLDRQEEVDVRFAVCAATVLDEVLSKVVVREDLRKLNLGRTAG